MDLDRGTLARLDRKLLVGLGHDEGFRMVRVPVTAATWSTWKRYCDIVGISMGRAIVELINGELSAVADSSGDGAASGFERLEQRLADREAALNRRERKLDEADERLRVRSDELRRTKCDIEIRERRLETATKMSTTPAGTFAKTGRNEPCPCGSEDKYKRCHGAPA